MKSQEAESENLINSGSVGKENTLTPEYTSILVESARSAYL